jgi:hypothetical protein
MHEAAETVHLAESQQVDSNSFAQPGPAFLIKSNAPSQEVAGSCVAAAYL